MIVTCNGEEIEDVLFLTLVVKVLGISKNSAQQRGM